MIACMAYSQDVVAVLGKLGDRVYYAVMSHRIQEGKVALAQCHTSSVLSLLKTITMLALQYKLWYTVAELMFVCLFYHFSCHFSPQTLIIRNVAMSNVPYDKDIIFAMGKG